MGSIVVLKQMVMIFALIILGYFMYKRKFVSEMVMKDLSAIVVNICCPAMILASVFQDMSDISRKNVGIVTGIGIVYYVLLIVFGYAFVKIFRVQTKEKEAYVLMSTFGNVGFIGFPVSLAILGHKSILYVVIFNFLYNIFIFTFGIALVEREQKASTIVGGRKLNSLPGRNCCDNPCSWERLIPTECMFLESRKADMAVSVWPHFMLIIGLLRDRWQEGNL